MVVLAVIETVTLVGAVVESIIQLTVGNSAVKMQSWKEQVGVKQMGPMWGAGGEGVWARLRAGSHQGRQLKGKQVGGGVGDLDFTLRKLR